MSCSMHTVEVKKVLQRPQARRGAFSPVVYGALAGAAGGRGVWVPGRVWGAQGAVEKLAG